MASVRLTQELKSTIRRRAEQAFELADPVPQLKTDAVQRLIQAIKDSTIYADLQVTATAYRTVLAKYAARTNGQLGPMSLAPENLDMGEAPRTMIKLTSQSPTSADVQARRSAEVQLPTPHTLFGRTGYWSKDVLQFCVEDLNDEEVKATSLKFFDDIDARTKRSREYNYKIMALLDNCTTLKQLFEVWPAAESFVPNEYLQKLNEKITRKQRAAQIKEEIDFDASDINQVVLTAKLMGQ